MALGKPYGFVERYFKALGITDGSVVVADYDIMERQKKIDKYFFFSKKIFLNFINYRENEKFILISISFHPSLFKGHMFFSFLLNFANFRKIIVLNQF